MGHASRYREVCFLLLIAGVSLAAASVVGASAVGSTARISGTVTNVNTGEPIQGVLVHLNDSNISTETSASGAFAMSVPAPTVAVLILTKDGYYGGPDFPQAYPGPVGDLTYASNGVRLKAGQSLVVRPKLAPDNVPFFNTGTSIGWAHKAGDPFTTMTVELNYDAFTDLPRNWPTSTLTMRLSDSKGHVLQSHTGSVAGAPQGDTEFRQADLRLGSTYGCSYFNNVRYYKRIDLMDSLIESYTLVSPSGTFTGQRRVVPDTQICRRTRLFVSREDDIKAGWYVDENTRNGADNPVPARLAFTIDHHHFIRVLPPSGGTYVTLHRYRKYLKRHAHLTFKLLPRGSFFRPSPIVRSHYRAAAHSKYY